MDEIAEEEWKYAVGLLNEPKKRKMQRFPCVLYEMLSNQSVAHVIKWVGQCIVIFDFENFIHTTLPLFFSATIYTFHRQLNYYGFEVVSKSKKLKIYQNKHHLITTLGDILSMERIPRKVATAKRDAALREKIAREALARCMLPPLI